MNRDSVVGLGANISRLIIEILYIIVIALRNILNAVISSIIFL